MDCRSCSCLLRLHMLRKISLTFTFNLLWPVLQMIGTETHKYKRSSTVHFCTWKLVVLLTCSVAFAGISFNGAQAKFGISSVSMFLRCENAPTFHSVFPNYTSFKIEPSWTFKVWIQPPRNGAAFKRNIQVRQCGVSIRETDSYVNLAWRHHVQIFF